MPLLILAGACLLGLGTAGLTFAGLSLLADLGRGLARRRRPARPRFWHDPVSTAREASSDTTREASR